MHLSSKPAVGQQAFHSRDEIGIARCGFGEIIFAGAWSDLIPLGGSVYVKIQKGLILNMICVLVAIAIVPAKSKKLRKARLFV
jgi:hypothetical protein